jgi:hypothetical protein
MTIAPDVSVQALAWLVAGLALVGGLRLAAPDHSGDVWARSVWLTFWFLVAPTGVLYALAAENSRIANWIAWIPASLCLAIPMLAWAGIALACRLLPPADQRSRWLAGSASFSTDRWWVALTVAPLLPIVLFGWSRLSTNADAYPTLVWATCVTFLLSALGVASSSPHAGQIAIRTESDDVSVAAAPQRRDDEWPALMKHAGISLDSFAEWPGGPARSQPTAPSAAVAAWARKLEAAGARGVPLSFVQLAQDLFASHTSDEPAGLLMAPDGAGQAEIVALIASEIAIRRGGVTLVVTAQPAPAVARQIGRWLDGLGGVGQRGVLLLEGDTTPATLQAAAVWVTDVATLSEDLLERLRVSADIASSIDLVVWWGLHECSGTRAAEAWAVSRRLHRLLDTYRSSAVAVLALVRAATHRDDEQLELFLANLLPTNFPKAAPRRVEWPATLGRPIRLHWFKNDEAFRSSSTLPARLQEPLMTTTAASVGTHWQTWAEREPEIPDADWETLLESTSNGAMVRHHLPGGADLADACVRRFEDQDATSLAGALGLIGRASPHAGVVHCVLLSNANPYLAYMSETLRTTGRARRGRRLLSARGHPRIARRHLLRALRERSDTRQGLAAQFKWDGVLTEAVVQELQQQALIDKRPVRFLTSEGTLARDFEYFNRMAQPALDPHAQILTLRDETRDDATGLLRRVAVERASIEAYPRAVFIAQGRRYRIREYRHLDQPLRQGWLACEPEGRYVRTRRIRLPHLSNFAPSGRPVAVQGSTGLISRQLCRIDYEEDVGGVLESDVTGTNRTIDLEPLSSRRFTTTGLALNLDATAGGSALATIAAALRHVLPVYVAVEPDALDVLAASDATLGPSVSGGRVILFELFAGGVGLIDALAEDDGLLRFLLSETRLWLEWMKREDASALARSPVTESVRGSVPISLGPAIELLASFDR